MLPSSWPWTCGPHWVTFWCCVRFAPVLVLGACAAFSLIFPAAAVPLGREPQMRVLVQESSRLSLRSDGDRLLQVSGLPGGRRQLRRMTVQLQAGRLNVDLDGRRHSLPIISELRITNQDPRGIWLGPRRYRGVLHLSAAGGTLRAINHLGIESYLPSVVGSEMPHRWPLAALQAQSVAARTYALRKRNRGGPWDVKATIASQVYKGVESETPSTLKAVASTRSLVLVHGGKLINAVFHSSSGGATEASGMVWRQQLPYLVSVPDHDQHSPMHRWQQRFDPVGLRQRLPETGGVDAVQVLSRSSSGRVRQARLKGPRGSLMLTGADLRSRLGLKSTLVEFEMVPPRSTSALATPLPVTPQRKASRIHQLTASVRGSRRNSSFLVAPPPPLRRGMQTARSVAGLQLLVRGQGYGHGVGMSQWGAHGLAQRGADFRSILRHYYRGADVMPYRPFHDSTLALAAPSESRWRG